MQTSKTKINKVLKKQLETMLFQVIADIKDKTEAEVFLSDFLTETELAVISRRLAVAYYLDKKRSYQNIKENLTVSSATVSTVAEQLKSKKGYEVALQKIRAEEWADKWSAKLSKLGRIVFNKNETKN